MTENFDLTPILNVILTLLSAIITAFIIPYLKKRLSAEKLEQLSYWTKIAVEAAEQLYGSKTGKQKKEYVVSFLLSKGFVLDIDEVNAVIESEVRKLGASSKN
ncbi:MAG: phage holin, LLH family [Acutalibacteraceae bacterium]